MVCSLSRLGKHHKWKWLQWTIENRDEVYERVKCLDWSKFWQMKHSINQQYKRMILKAASLLNNDREQIRSQRPKQYLEQGGMLETIGIQSASTTWLTPQHRKEGNGVKMASGSTFIHTNDLGKFRLLLWYAEISGHLEISRWHCWCRQNPSTVAGNENSVLGQILQNIARKPLSTGDMYLLWANGSRLPVLIGLIAGERSAVHHPKMEIWPLSFRPFSSVE